MCATQAQQGRAEMCRLTLILFVPGFFLYSMELHRVAVSLLGCSLLKASFPHSNRACSLSRVFLQPLFWGLAPSDYTAKKSVKQV